MKWIRNLQYIFRPNYLFVPVAVINGWFWCNDPTRGRSRFGYTSIRIFGFQVAYIQRTRPWDF